MVKSNRRESWSSYDHQPALSDLNNSSSSQPEIKYHHLDSALKDCHQIVNLFLAHQIDDAVVALELGAQAGSFYHAAGYAAIKAGLGSLDLDKEGMKIALKGALDALKMTKSFRKKTSLVFKVDANTFSDGKLIKHSSR